MASAAAAIIITAASYSQQRKAGKAARSASKVEARKAEIENARSRRQTIAQGNRLRAQTIAQGTNQGVGGGSSVAGAAGAVVSQTASAVGQSQINQDADRASFNLNQKANQYLGNASTIDAIGSVAQTFMPAPKPKTNRSYAPQPTAT